MSLTISGLDALRDALRELPETLTTEAGAIITDAARTTFDEVRAAYGGHVHTGNLVKGLRLKTLTAGRFGVRMEVRSAAQHALLFEIGTQLRYTRRGAARGRMPPANIFIPTAQRNRRAMYRDLVALLERQGLTVTGGSAW